MKSKTVIITGANSGIGKAAASAIAKQGHRVVLACRNQAGAEAAQKEIGRNFMIAPLDLARRSSIHAFTDWVQNELRQVDVLINDAADFDLSCTQREMTPDGFERIWFTNHLAPVLLTDRLMNLLIASPQGRILNVSPKGLHAYPFLTVDLKDPMFASRPFSVSKAYYQSKLAQMMFTTWLSNQLAGTLVTVNCIWASHGRIDLNRHPSVPQWLKNIHTIKAILSISPEQMAETYVKAALDHGVKNLTGRRIGYPFKETGMPVYAKDPLCIEQVMQLTYRQLGISPAVTYEQIN